jgi:MFS family permease
VTTERDREGREDREATPAKGAKGAKGARGLVPPLLRDTEFRRFWTGSTVSMFGDQVSSIAVPLTAVLALHAGAAAMGYLTALAWLPSLLLGMHAGAWVDRRGRRRQTMIACDLGRFGLLAAIPVCWALHVLTLWQLYAVIFAAGTLSTVFNVADTTLFDLMFFALFTLYAIRTLHVSAGLLGVVLGCGAIGGVLGAAVTKRIAARFGVGMAYVAGAFGFTVPLALAPLAATVPGHASGGPFVLVMLFAAEFLSGFGVMVLDISIGAIFAAVIPDTVRSRVGGAFSAINYGTRPVGALLGGLLGTELGVRPALWIAVIGGVTGAALLVPSPLPRFRLPSQPSGN